MPLIKETILHCTLGSSDKIYIISQVHDAATNTYYYCTAYGRNGAAKFKLDEEKVYDKNECSSRALDTISAKQKKGYKVIPSYSGADTLSPKMQSFVKGSAKTPPAPKISTPLVSEDFV